MELSEIKTKIVLPALAQLPAKMGSVLAIVMLLAICLQESRGIYRRQLDNGPARGLWQFELGTEKSRGGVWGVFLHPASHDHLMALCLLHSVPFDPVSIYNALEKNDIFACGVARLLLWTDALPLPAATDVEGAWALYAKRAWRPGKPHRETWDAFHARAVVEAAR